MESSLEPYHLIVEHVESKSDLCTLCRVNKGFQRAAEHALYNNVYASDACVAFGMCSLFATTPHIAVIVETLTLLVGDVDDDSKPQSEVCLPDDFWPTVSNALRETTNLRSLNLYLDNPGDAAQAWILNRAGFRLRSFRCDLQWDAHLVSFLNMQTDIDDLYIMDYEEPSESVSSAPLNPDSLPNLSTLECTFAEAACALIPTRPLSRLKTCFSETRLPKKMQELSLLFSKLMETTRPLLSLDIADSSYSISFSMELLAAVVRLQNQVHDLRYLGTLVLPVDGQDRLKFYGFLRTLRALRCIEVDVSDWEPPPPIPAGLRALASEMRLYCPSLHRVVFVDDLERTMMATSRGIYDLDTDSDAENVWREY